MKAQLDQEDDLNLDIQQYLSFIMDAEEYAVGILSVREIRGWEPVTPIPNSPEYVKGFINLRGSVVPIIDLRQRFNLEVKEFTDITVVIILNIDKTNEGKELVGIVVDAVSEVYDIKSDNIKPPPKLGGHISAQYIKGIAKIGGKNIILTDVMSLIDADELLETSGMV